MTDPADASGTGDSGKPAASSDALAEAAAKMMAGQAQMLALMTAWSMGLTGKMASIWLDAVKDSPARRDAETGKAPVEPAPGADAGRPATAAVVAEAPMPKPAIRAVAGPQAEAGTAGNGPRAAASGSRLGRTAARAKLSVVGGTRGKAAAPASMVQPETGAPDKRVAGKPAAARRAPEKAAQGKAAQETTARDKGAPGKAASDRRAPASRTKDTAEARVAAAQDDLKRIGGIGPRLEKVLNGMGITRYEHLARMSGRDLKKLDDSLGLDNRAIRDDWPSKAKALLEGGHGEAEG